MITDIFARRYEQSLGYPDIFAEWFGPLFMQASHIVFNDLHPVLGLSDSFYRDIHGRLARELGKPALIFQAESYMQRCGIYLASPYSYSDGSVSDWVKTRLSMLELLFRGIEDEVRQREQDSAKPKRTIFGRTRTTRPSAPPLRERVAFDDAVRELNARLRASKASLTYHNGMLQMERDELTSDRIAKPFWEIVSDTRWAVVDHEMKEAWDRMDSGEADAPTHATRALESLIKIISDNQGWSTGNEKGAVSYVDNLRGDRSGRFIAVWEADALASIFRNIRNPLSHGAGTAPPEPLTEEQRLWAIESCTIWIKSLIKRL